MTRPQVRIYPVTGGFVVADAAGWIPGTYPTRRAALRAAAGHGRPRAKDRAYARREGPVVSWGGMMKCPCGLTITWGHVRRAEYDRLLDDLAMHEAWCDEGV